MFKNLRSVLSYSQIPVRIASRQDGHKLYRVRLVPQSKRVHVYLRSFLILGGFHVAASVMLQTFMGEREEPFFIPLGFVKEEKQRKYIPSDPDHKAYVRFGRNGKKQAILRAKVYTRLLQLLERSPEIKFGGNVRVDGALLYFNYPISPPPKYKRKGLQISPTPRDNASFSGLLYPFQIFTFKYEWVSRPVSPKVVHRLSNTLYPYKILYSIYSSVYRTLNRLYTLPDSGRSVDSMNDLVGLGTTTIKQGLGDANRIFQSMATVAPPPVGHVIIDGIVTVTGNNLILGIDLMASCDPETLGDLRVHKARVRYAARPRRQAVAVGVGKQPKDIIEGAVKAAVEPQKQEKVFVKKEEKIDEQQEQKIRKKKEPEDTKPLVGMIEEKRGAQISDSSPGEAGDKSGRNKDRKADVDDAASSKP